MDTSHSLPLVDEPTATVAATAQQTWAALMRHLEKASNGYGRAVGARLLGCEHVRTAGALPDVGAQVPGFVVAESQPPRLLALRGRHRTSIYALTFRIDDAGPGGCRLTAESRAAFPGVTGRLYRAAVIGSGAHGRLMTSMLAAIKQRAEASQDQGSTTGSDLGP
jgi:hypothetical protein